MNVIAHIETPFKEKFGVPRQAGLVDYEARIVFEPEYRVAEAVRGIEEFDYLWLIWLFHLNDRKVEKPKGLKVEKPKGDHELSASSPLRLFASSPLRPFDHPTLRPFDFSSLRLFDSPTWSPTVRPPRLGGNRRVGVFATRSPFRPNPIGLSSVRLLRVEPGPVLVVSGADLVDGTPILDIKPYIPYADSHPGARSGFASEAPQRLEVIVPQAIASSLPPSLLQPLVDTIAQDPRPHYQHDPDRRYAIIFADFEALFSVVGNQATVLRIVKKS